MMTFKFSEVLTNVCYLFYSFLIQSTGAKLGAIRFDRDLRAVTAYLASQTVFGDGREKFVRLQQMSTLLNLDHVRVLLLFTNTRSHFLA
jgi:conserved oligomeric Golgi complex subunit 4